MLFKSVEKKTIAAGDKALVDLGISIAVPAGTYGRVAPRSGLGEFITIFFFFTYIHILTIIIKSCKTPYSYRCRCH